MIRARIRVDGRLAGGLQALLGAPMAAYSGCGERDGGIGHGKRRSRTGLARVCGDVVIPSQEAPPRPGILRSFNGSSSHGTPPRPDLNGLSRHWEAALAALDAQMDAGDADDTAIDNGAVRVRKAPAMQRRKPTPLQTARWNAVQKANAGGCRFEGSPGNSASIGTRQRSTWKL